MAKRFRAKFERRIQGVLGAEERVLEIGPGFVGSHPTTSLWSGLGAAVLIEVVLVIATRGIVIVGGLGLVLIVLGLRNIVGKPCWVASTTEGLTLVSRSWWQGTPRAILARTTWPRSQGLPAQGKWVHVLFGSRRVWLRRDQLRAPVS